MLHSTNSVANYNAELSENNPSTSNEESISNSNHVSLQDSSASANVEDTNRDVNNRKNPLSISILCYPLYSINSTRNHNVELSKNNQS